MNQLKKQLKDIKDQVSLSPSALPVPSIYNLLRNPCKFLAAEVNCQFLKYPAFNVLSKQVLGSALLRHPVCL